MPAKILVLGGLGFLGSNLIRHCVGQGHTDLLTIDIAEPHFGERLRPLAEVWGSVRFLHGDIRDSDLLDQIVQGRDVIFNCAAQTSHTLSFADPLYDADVNSAACLRLLEAVRARNPAAVIVYPSSRLLKNTRIGLFSWPSCVSRPPPTTVRTGDTLSRRGGQRHPRPAIRDTSPPDSATGPSYRRWQRR